MSEPAESSEFDHGLGQTNEIDNAYPNEKTVKEAKAKKSSSSKGEHSKKKKHKSKDRGIKQDKSKSDGGEGDPSTKDLSEKDSGFNRDVDKKTKKKQKRDKSKGDDPIDGDGEMNEAQSVDNIGGEHPGPDQQPSHKESFKAVAGLAVASVNGGTRTTSQDDHEDDPTINDSLASLRSSEGLGADGNYIFVEPLLDKFKCINCSRPLRVPLLMQSCGHHCCSSCQSRILRQGKCPADCIPVKTYQVSMDHAIERQMDELEVRCSSGCDWMGRFADLGRHLKECQLKAVDCPNKCGQVIEQRNLDDHLSRDCGWRQITCEFCQSTLSACDELEHIKQCPDFLVDCPNKCQTTNGPMPRRQLKDHLASDCPLHPIDCPFIGCEWKARQRRQLEAHVGQSQASHLTLLNASHVRMQELLQAQIKEIGQLKLALDQQARRQRMTDHCSGAYFIWKIESFRDKLQTAKMGKQTAIYSPPFYLYRYGYRVAMWLYPFGVNETRGRFLSLYAAIGRGEFDDLLTWPFKCQVKFTLLNLTNDKRPGRDIEHIVRPKTMTSSQGQSNIKSSSKDHRNVGFALPLFFKIDDLVDSSLLVDDAIFIRVQPINAEELLLNCS